MSTPTITPQPQQQTLAQRVRAKFPGAYDDLDDSTLEQKVLAKYPAYSDLPQTPKPQPAAPSEHFAAAPTGALPWLRSAENDVRYGTQNTGIGKFLSFIGAPGINRGVSEEAANQIAGPLIGPITAAEGIAEMRQHPLMGALHAGSGVLQAAAPALSFAGPEAAEASSAMPGKIADAASEVASDVVSGAKNVNNALASKLRYPASARQSQLGRPGTIKNALPSFLQKYAIPDWVIPKGDVGTPTNPGAFAEIPVRMKDAGSGIESIAERDATRANVPFAGEEQVAEPAAASTLKRPLQPTVGTPEDFQIYDQQMSRLKSEASDAGTYSAARGKVGKKLNYQQRIAGQKNRFYGE